MKHSHRIVTLLVALVLLVSTGLSGAASRPAQASTINAVGFTGGVYTQDFDSLPQTGANLTWVDNTTLPGWYSTRYTYNAGDGGSNTGSQYSFGNSTVSANRALGSLASSSTGTITFGVRLKNTTGGTITGLTIQYTGEQWRQGGYTEPNPAPIQKLTFSYRAGGTPILGAGTWVDYRPLDFTAPQTGTASTKLDGHDAANRAVLSSTIYVNLPPNEEISLRWTDIKDAGNNHALAIDDLTVTATVDGTTIACPSAVHVLQGTTKESDLITAVAPTSFVLTFFVDTPNGANVGLKAINWGFTTGSPTTYKLVVGVNAALGTYQVSTSATGNNGTTAACTITEVVYPTLCPDPPVTNPLFPIGTVQGTVDVSAKNGQLVTVRGTVAGRMNQSANDLNGFFVQDAGDGDVNTSDGIFVYYPGGPDVQVGDSVQVSGLVTEYNKLTEITNPSVTYCGSPISPAAATITLPVAAVTDLEKYESMKVSVAGTLTVDQNYFLNRYGQITVSGAGRVFLPKNGNGLGDTAEYNARRMLIVDDMGAMQNPSPVPFFDRAHPQRAGDTLPDGVTGILDQGAINSSFPAGIGYRVQATVPLVFTQTNPRTTAPASVGAGLRVGGMNVYNYFTTLNPTPYPVPPPAGYDTNNKPRGATTAEELARQQVKLVNAIKGLNPDVLGLTEIEKYAPAMAAETLVAALNADPRPGVYAVISDPPLGYGGDYIKTTIIYQPSRVSPVGSSISYSDPIFDRFPVAQTFQSADGDQFTVIVNHFKSKSSCPTAGTDPDNQDNGQGCWNAKRVLQAQKLLTFVDQLKLSTGDPDVLVVGDLNAYGEEDPIITMTNGGLVNEMATRVAAADRYSYLFDGAAGYLDQGLATSSLDAKISGATFWHINADEALAIDYTTRFKADDPFDPTVANRASDHDPVLVGLTLKPFANLTFSQDTFTAAAGKLATIELTAVHGDYTGVPADVLVDLKATFTPPIGVNLGGLQIEGFAVNGGLESSIGVLTLASGQTSFWLSDFPATSLRPPLNTQSNLTARYRFKFTLGDALGGAAIGLGAQVVGARAADFNTPALWYFKSNQTASSLLVIRYGVGLTPATDAKSGNPGTMATYTLTLTNTGTATDSYTIGLDSPSPAWQTQLSTAVVTDLAAGASVPVTVSVTIPANSPGLATDVAKVNAASQGDASRSSVSTFTTTANVVRGVEVTPLVDARTAIIGHSVVYILDVKNTGNAVDTFNVSFESMGDWTTTILPETITDLAPGATATFTVTVVIPLTAQHHQTDISLIRVASAGNPAVVVTIQATTTAERLFSYIPILMR